ncbi:MAG: hypothetical protein R3B74_10850 [Nitrospirales bacterium]|nr:hypothetical protein [Nitrospirales bacterium]
MEIAGNGRKMRWFSRLVTVGLFVVCNALLFVGLWASGVDLEAALSKPELYDPQNGHCVGVTWAKVDGVDGLIKVCTEWLDFSDISGEIHRLPSGKPLAMGADGNLSFSGQTYENYRLIGLVIFVIVVVASGMWLKRFLIGKYHYHLQTSDRHTV